MNELMLKFFYSIMIGIVISVPIGPVSVLCIRYTLKQSLLAGIIVGIGAASGNIIYTIIASVGVDMINDYVAWAENGFKITGGIFLLFLSLHSIYTERTAKVEINPTKYKRDDSNKYIFTISFFTTILSPMTIILFVSMFSAIDLELDSMIEYVVISMGVFIGTISWMTVTALLLQYVKHRITNRTAYYINFLSNISIAGFGFVAAGSALYSYFI